MLHPFISRHLPPNTPPTTLSGDLRSFAPAEGLGWPCTLLALLMFYGVLTLSWLWCAVGVCGCMWVYGSGGLWVYVGVCGCMWVYGSGVLWVYVGVWLWCAVGVCGCMWVYVGVWLWWAVGVCACMWVYGSGGLACIPHSSLHL